MIKRNRKLAVVILAAGKGKRMRDSSNAKVMAKLAGKPLIEHVAEQVKYLSPDIVIAVIGFQKDKVQEFLNTLDLKFNFVEQNEQLGTGHAVDMAKPILNGYDGDVLILCGDVPNLKAKTLDSFIESHFEMRAGVSVLSTIAANPAGYGRIVRDDAGNFIKIIEDKDANPTELEIDEINSGVYIVSSKLLFSSLNEVSNNNAQGEYYLTDIIGILREKGALAHSFALAEFDELQGVNSPEDLKRAELYYNKFLELT